MFDSELKTPISQMISSDIAKLLDVIELNVSVSGKAKEYIYACMLKGAKVPGYYLDKGRSKRTWENDVTEEKLKKVGELLGKDTSDLITHELITIPKIEEKWGKSAQVRKELAPFIHKEEGKPQLKREK